MPSFELDLRMIGNSLKMRATQNLRTNLLKVSFIIDHLLKIRLRANYNT